MVSWRTLNSWMPPVGVRMGDGKVKTPTAVEVRLVFVGAEETA
jgi:hypothetical protein